MRSRVRVRPSFKQTLNDGGVSVDGCQIQSRDVIACSSISASTRGNQQLHDRDVLTLSGPMQSSGAIRFRSIHANVQGEQGANSSDILFLNRVDEPKIA